MRALLVDAGNSRIKWGVLSGGELAHGGAVDTARLRDEGASVLTTQLDIDMQQVLVSNVAGATTGTRLAGVLGAHCGCEVRFARSEAAFDGLVNAYREPRRMGVDRWLALCAAWSEWRSACLVVDAGTAVTVDAIDADGQHLGGQILAGAPLSMRALGERTSDLPDLGDAPGGAPALDELFAARTEDAIRNGAWTAVIGAVERAMAALQSRSGEAHLVLTGGDADSMLGAMPSETQHRPDLVLQGLARILESGS